MPSISTAPSACHEQVPRPRLAEAAWHRRCSGSYNIFTIHYTNFCSLHGIYPAATSGSRPLCLRAAEDSMGVTFFVSALRQRRQA